MFTRSRIATHRRARVAVFVVPTLTFMLAGCGSEPAERTTQNQPSPRASTQQPAQMDPGPADGVMQPSLRSAPDTTERRVQQEGTPQAIAPSAGVEGMLMRPATTAAHDDPNTALFAGFSAPKPAAWQYRAPAPTSTMRVAEYAVPGITGSDQANIIVYQFPGGGSFQANVDRWITQFRSDSGEPVKPELSTIDADGIRVEVAELSGAYRGMNSPDFAGDHTLIAAMIETAGNPVFIQLVGPSATVGANREAFMAMLRGIRRYEPMK